MTARDIQSFLIENKKRLVELFGGEVGFGVKDISAHQNNNCFVLTIYLEEKKPIIYPPILVVKIDEEEFELSVEIGSEHCGKAKINSSNHDK